MPDPSRVLTAFRHVSRAPEVLKCATVIDEWWPIASSYVGLRTLPLPFDVHCRDGAAYTLEEFYDIETLWQIYVRRVYDVRPEHHTIVDAGANIGLFACYAAGINPGCVVHAVEPFPPTVRRLRDTVRRNGLGGRIRIHDVALSSASGSASMSAVAPASQMVHVVHDQVSNSTDAAVAVPALTLKDLIERIDAPQIDLLKMDIEGSEYDVLGTADAETLAPVRSITLEYHRPDPHRPSAKQELARHLASCGFGVREDPADPAEYGILHFTR
jgi:FkbM family methyltransferase